MIRWLSGLGIGLAAVVVIGGFGWLTIREQIMESKKQNTQATQALKTANIDEVNEDVTEFSDSIKLVEKVLNQQIIFSELLKQMAAVLPNGSNLTSLNISDASGGSTLDITVKARDSTTATQVQVNLSDPENEIFADADIQNISCDPTGSEDGFACTVTIRAQFSEDNPFLFINQGKETS